MNMHNPLQKVFKKNSSVVIGSLHFPPLLGFEDFPGYAKTVKMALSDLNAYERGGVDGLFLENNYGLSGEKITTAQAIAMGYLIAEIKRHTSLPLGVSVLWNDYETAFALARTYGLKFIRIPVFVDEVEAYCGVIKGNPKHVLKTQQKMKAAGVSVYADILVKHSKHISGHSLETAAKKAVKAGADAVIVTGNWTGESPDHDTLKSLRTHIGPFPILVGSGASKENVNALLEYADGVIVSTSLKQGAVKKSERNVKGFTQRVSVKKVRDFTTKVHEKAPNN